jgi:hypothetical protein
VRVVFGFEQCLLHAFARLRSYGVVFSNGAAASDLCGMPTVQLTTGLRHVRTGQDAVLLLSRMPVPLGHGPTRTVRRYVAAMTTTARAAASFVFLSP